MGAVVKRITELRQEFQHAFQIQQEFMDKQ